MKNTKQTDAIQLEAYPTPASAVVGRLMDKEALVVLAERGQAKVLNEVGARIWSLADGFHTVRQIIATLCAEFNVSTSDAQTDTLAFLQLLLEQEAITVRDTPAEGGTLD